MRGANTVLWRTDLWQGALKGHETFLGSSFDASKFVPPCQFWMPDRFLVADAQLREASNLSPDVELFEGMLLICEPSRGLTVVSFYSPVVDDGNLRNYWPRLRIALMPNGSINEALSASIMALTEFMNLPICEIEKPQFPRSERRRREKEGRCVPET